MTQYTKEHFDDQADAYIASALCLTMAANAMAQPSTADEYYALHIIIKNPSLINMPLTTYISCSEFSPSSIKYGDDMLITNAKIFPGGAPGTCTLTFAVSSSDSSDATVTDLPIILHTTSDESYGGKFTSMSAENASSETMIIDSKGYQVTTSFERNIMTAKIDSVT